jgi:uncharacterized protein (TIGR01777 family)
LEGFDAVVHLAGESIAGRWTAEKKAKARDSRVNGTLLLSDALAGLERPPKTMVSASAVGYYGNRGDEVLTEDSFPGQGFLAGVCEEWEAATESASSAGIRVVRTRFGMVLASKGGALEQMIRPFRLGVAGKLGSGKQYWSWVAIDDVTGIVQHALATESLQGPVNAVSPNPVTNEQFTQTLARIIGRPARLTVPPFALRLAFGDMADEALLSSARVVPQRLLTSGYSFSYPDLERALRHLLKDN